MRTPLLALALLASACGDGSSESFDATAYDGGAAGPSDASAPSTSDPAADAASGTADRPETDTRTISIEGMDQAIPVRRVRYPDAPMPFETYLPADWLDDSASSGEGTAVVFHTPDRAAEMSVFMPSEANRANVVEMARAVADSRGGAQPTSDLPDGATAQFTFFSGSDAAGSVTVYEHGGLPYYVVEEFPFEYGDGFAPRARMALEEIRWLGDGQ